MGRKKLVCSNCGSNELEITNSDYCICKHCGTKTFIDKKSTNITNNEIHLHIDKIDKGLPFYEVVATNTPEYFLRSALIALAKNNETPSDIFDEIQFEPVETVYRKYAKINLDIKVSYTVSIGYDRQEKYKTTESVYNRSKNRYENKQVEKTRTVTDWSPLNGSKDFAYSEGICLDSYDFDADGEVSAIEKVFSKWVDNQPQLRYNANKNIVSPETPSEEQIDKVIDSCSKDASYKCKNSLPGDRYTSFSSSIRESHEIKSYVVPQYILNYTLEDEDYTIKSLCGYNDMMAIQYPSANKKLLGKATKQTKPLLIGSLVALSMSILTSLIFLIASINGISEGTKVLGIILCVGLCLTAVILSQYMLKKRETFIYEFLKSQQLQKLKGLEVLLKRYKLDKLTEQEIEEIKMVGAENER